MKNEIKNYILNNKKLQETKEKEKETKDKIKGSYYIYQELKANNKTEEEIKKEIETYKQQEEEIKKEIENIQNKIKIYNIKENILYNNIIISIYNKYKNNIDDIMAKYENKAIGEKTKEKMQNEIKDLFLQDDVFKNDNIFIYIQNSFNYYERQYLKIIIEITKKQDLDDGGFKYIYNFKLSIDFCKYTNVYENIENKKYIDVMAIYSYNDEKMLFSNQFEEEEKNNNYKYIEDPEKEAKAIIKLYNINKLKFKFLQEKLKDVKDSNNAAISQLKLSYNNDEIYKLKANINLY